MTHMFRFLGKNSFSAILAGGFLFLHIFIIMILWQRPYAQNVSEIVSGDPQKFDFSRETKIQQTFIARNDYLRGLGIKLHNFYTQSRYHLTTTLLMGDVIIYSEKTNLANLV